MFEHSLIGLDERKKSRRGWFSLPMAIVIHLAAFATFTFASYWDVAELPDPPTNDVFYVSMPPPPPPIRGSGKPPTEAVVKQAEIKPPTPQQIVQPPDVPTELAPVASQVVSDLVSDLPAGGDPNGVDEGGAEGGDPLVGVPFSTGTIPVPSSGTGPAEPQQAVNDEPIVVGGAVTKPEILVKTQPRYTELARRANIEGFVGLKAVIDEQGYVTDLQVLKALPMGLDKAAMDAVRTWRFKPATLHGRPVKVYYNLTVHFTIQR
ncbi:MAG TPA: TonB family protein [Thermoanaerobaculia bacterium]|jgi:protein TonB|nr:TonB family protein [Thermoanaerobaculia bacterium]